MGGNQKEQNTSWSFLWTVSCLLSPLPYMPDNSISASVCFPQPHMTPCHSRHLARKCEGSFFRIAIGPLHRHSWYLVFVFSFLHIYAAPCNCSMYLSGLNQQLSNSKQFKYFLNFSKCKVLLLSSFLS